MKTLLLKKSSLILLTGILTTLSIEILAQGTVTGIIKDEATKSTLPGATIVIEGTNYGVIADNYGVFTLTGVPEGKNTLVISYVGYIPEMIQIDLSPGEIKKLDVALDVESIGVSEVIITSQYLGQKKAINEQLNSDALVNVVSEEKMKELPDVNAAEAIGRISGISLQRSQGEGQKVVVRGLEPKFSNITINGIKVPSNSEDRSVDLSMISPEMLQGIEVFKSPTPDMDAESVGGTVNLRINKAPDDPKLKLKTAGGYNGLRKDWGDYYFSGSYSRRFFNKKMGMLLQANTERVNRSSDDIRTSYRQGYFTDPDTDTLGLYNLASRGDIRITEEIRKRHGVSANLDYRFRKGNINLYSFYNLTTRDRDQLRTEVVDANEIRNHATRERIESDVWSAMLSSEYALGIVKTEVNFSYAKTTNNTPYEYIGRWYNSANSGLELPVNLQQDLSSWFNYANFEADSVVTRDMMKNFRNLSEDNLTAGINFEIPLRLGNNMSLTFKLGGKFNLLQRERENGGDYHSWYYNGVNHGEDFPGVEYRISSGDYYIYNQSFWVENYSGRSVNSFRFYNPLDIERVVDFIDTYNTYENGYIDNFEEKANNLTATENLAAGYIMAKFKFKDVLTIIPGVRVENSNNIYNSFTVYKFSNYEDGQYFEPVTNAQNYLEILPHLHLRFEPFPWYQLRFSAAKTLARPDFNYLALNAFVNRAEGRNSIDQGNPNLKHMTSMNYDLNMSFNSFRYGLITIGAFYKDIKNIFYEENGFNMYSDSLAAAYGWPDFQGTTLNTYANSPEATVYGFEVDVQTNLKFLPKPFNGFVISTNFTRLFSEATKYETRFDRGDPLFNPVTGTVEYPDQQNIPMERKISIPGQVDLIFNISIGYEYKGFSLRISGTHQGDYLDQPNIEPTGIRDEYRLAFFRWDLAYKQKITKNLELFFTAANLSDMVETTLVKNYRFTNESINAYPGKVYTGRVFTYGLRFNL